MLYPVTSKRHVLPYAKHMENIGCPFLELAYELSFS